MTTEFWNFANFGFIKVQVPDDLLQKLQQEVDNIDLDTAEPFNKNLAGNIKKEFLLHKNQLELENFIVAQCREYAANWDVTYTTRDLTVHNLHLSKYWCNIQHKYEFNPVHAHDGVYSFVIWLKIPYKIEDEMLTDFCKMSNSPRAGMFTFMYTNIFGEIKEAEFHVDKRFEGWAFVFPGCLQHAVYPFFSTDEARISISGNLNKK